MSEFLNNTMKLVSGSLIAQIIGMLLYPVMARLYSPSDFGVFQIFLSIVTLIAIIASFSYHLAIMLPEKDEDAAHLVVLCTLLVVIISLLTYISSLFFGNIIIEKFMPNTPEIKNYLIFIPIVVFLNGMFNVLNYWSSRKVRFGIVAKASVANIFSSKTSQVGFGYYKPSPLGLIAGYMLGYSLSTLTMMTKFREDMHYFRQVSFGKIKQLALRYKNFPQYSTFSVFANTMSFQLIPFMLGYFYNSTVIGYFSFANQILALPVSLIGGSTQQVFFQKAAEVKQNNGDFKAIVSDIHQKLMAIGAFPVIGFMIIGEDLFSFFLGNKWYTAGLYAKILAPWIYIRFIYSPISSVFDILEKQNVELLLNTLFIIIIGLALYIGGISGNPFFTIALLSAAGTILWTIANFYLSKISGSSFIEEAKVMVKYIFISLILAIPLFIFKIYGLHIYILMLTFVLILLIYSGLIIYQDEKLKENILNKFFRKRKVC